MILPVTLDEFGRMALHLEAFQLWVTSTEDVISWVWSLKRWQPDGPVEKRLFALTRYPGAIRDTHVRDFLRSLDVGAFRELLKIPSPDEVAALGDSSMTAAEVESSLRSKLDGFIETAERRLRERRAMVEAFNKSKHGFPVYQQLEGQTPVLIFPIGDKQQPDRLYRMKVDIGEARWFATQAALAQLVLHDTLATILVYRYGERYEQQPWAQRINQLPGWKTHQPDR